MAAAGEWRDEIIALTCVKFSGRVETVVFEL